MRARLATAPRSRAATRVAGVRDGPRGVDRGRDDRRLEHAERGGDDLAGRLAETGAAAGEVRPRPGRVAVPTGPPAVAAGAGRARRRRRGPQGRSTRWRRSVRPGRAACGRATAARRPSPVTPRDPAGSDLLSCLAVHAVVPLRGRPPDHPRRRPRRRANPTTPPRPIRGAGCICTRRPALLHPGHQRTGELTCSDDTDTRTTRTPTTRTTGGARLPGSGSTATSRRGGSTPASPPTAPCSPGRTASSDAADADTRDRQGAVDPRARRDHGARRGRPSAEHARHAPARPDRRAAGAERADDQPPAGHRHLRLARRRSVLRGMGAVLAGAGRRAVGVGRRRHGRRAGDRPRRGDGPGDPRLPTLQPLPPSRCSPAPSTSADARSKASAGQPDPDLRRRRAPPGGRGRRAVGAVVVSVVGLGVAIHLTTQLNDLLPIDYGAILRLDDPFAGVSERGPEQPGVLAAARRPRRPVGPRVGRRARPGGDVLPVRPPAVGVGATALGAGGLPPRSDRADGPRHRGQVRLADRGVVRRPRPGLGAARCAAAGGHR